MSKPKEEPKRDVIKSSAAIHIHNSITLLQRRVWNVLLFNAYNELEKKEEHQIALKDLSTLVGYDSHDMDYLKEAAEAMVRCTVQWDILDKDGLLSGASRRCWHKGASSVVSSPMLIVRSYASFSITRVCTPALI
jgi:hypothetical protein